MTRPHLNYDRIAATYHRRYAVSRLAGVQAGLELLARQSSAQRVLEVGCGTGHWLGILQPFVRQAVGVDMSRPMLGQAQARDVPAGLVQGRAGRLPFSNATFDLVVCVNALHHFDSVTGYLRDACRLLRPGGALAIVGLAPHGRKADWYLYEYFVGAFETDLRRFPTWGRLVDELVGLGVSRITWEWAERIEKTYFGREVLEDPFLDRDSTSQLALLSAEAYAAGRRRLEEAIAEGERRGQAQPFPANVHLGMLVGYMEYDVRHNLIRLTDPLSRATHFGYDGRDNLTIITNTMEATTSFTYDSHG